MFHYDYKTPYCEPFHRCNARVLSWYNPDTHVYVWELISYNTSVCRLCFKTEHSATARPTGKLESVSFGRYAKCSATTWRQVSRFVSEYAAFYETALHAFSSLCKGYRASKYGLRVEFENGVKPSNAVWVELGYDGLNRGGVHR